MNDHVPRNPHKVVRVIPRTDEPPVRGNLLDGFLEETCVGLENAFDIEKVSAHKNSSSLAV
jgi:hypothetical protein